MKAVRIHKYGGTEVIEVTQDAVKPLARSGQVVAEVHAASLNRMDTAIRSGNLQKMMPMDFPLVVGGDFAGTITEVGQGVSNLKVGDQIYGQAAVYVGGSGSLAEFTSADSSKVAKKPGSIDMAQAASLPLVGSSAIQALEEHIGLQKGQKILIHGGTGGIGSLAIQLAKLHGAMVATTVGGDNKELAKKLGADVVIDYKTQDFASLIKDYDAVLVTVPNVLTDSYKILKKGGVLVSMIGVGDENLAKEYGITAIAQMTIVNQAKLTRLAELIDSQKLRSLVDKTFTLSEAKEAFDYFEQKHPKGKVVVTVKK